MILDDMLWWFAASKLVIPVLEKLFLGYVDKLTPKIILITC